jgi:hypothetical protein
MVQLVRAVVAERPGREDGQVVHHVPPRLAREVVLRSRQVGRRQAGRELPDRRRVAREAAVAAHAVALQRDPVRAEIAEIGHRHGDVARMRRGDGGAVVVPLLAEQEDVGHAMLVEEAGR